MPTTFGLEFEVQGLDTYATRHLLEDAGIDWATKYDGSVPNGAEVVSPILTANRLNEAVKVTKLLKANGARVDRKTGYHAHLGARIFPSHGDLAQFVLNYYSAHSAIASLVAPSRLFNNYCEILNRQEAEAQAEFTNAGNDGSYDRSMRPGRARYKSLNLEAMLKHGTIEIRLHQGTLNGVKAVAWAQFIEALALDVVNNQADYTQASADAFHDCGEFTPWSGGRVPSLLNCHALLNRLVRFNLLNPATGDYLKNRAGKLHA